MAPPWKKNSISVRRRISHTHKPGLKERARQIEINSERERGVILLMGRHLSPRAPNQYSWSCRPVSAIALKVVLHEAAFQTSLMNTNATAFSSPESISACFLITFSHEAGFEHSSSALSDFIHQIFSCFHVLLSLGLAVLQWMLEGTP